MVEQEAAAPAELATARRLGNPGKSGSKRCVGVIAKTSIMLASIQAAFPGVLYIGIITTAQR